MGTSNVPLAGLASRVRCAVTDAREDTAVFRFLHPATSPTQFVKLFLEFRQCLSNSQKLNSHALCVR